MIVLSPHPTRNVEGWCDAAIALRNMDLLVDMDQSVGFLIGEHGTAPNHQD